MTVLQPGYNSIVWEQGCLGSVAPHRVKMGTIRWSLCARLLQHPSFSILRGTGLTSLQIGRTTHRFFRHPLWFLLRRSIRCKQTQKINEAIKTNSHKSIQGEKSFNSLLSSPVLPGEGHAQKAPCAQGPPGGLVAAACPRR